MFGMASTPPVTGPILTGYRQTLVEAPRFVWFLHISSAQELGSFEGKDHRTFPR